MPDRLTVGALTAAELRDQIAETIHRRICEHSREDCIENLGNCERATDSAMPLISTALDEGNVLARLLSGALNDAIRTLRELAEKAAGEPIPFDDVDLYADVVLGLLDQLARIDAILARSEHVCEPSFCDWKRDIRDIREARGL